MANRWGIHGMMNGGQKIVNKIRILLLMAALTLSATTQAGVLQGRDVVEKLKGNTARVYDVGCTEDEPNGVYFFHADGRVTAMTRPCNLPAERAQTQQGRWQIQNNRFCIRELGNFDAFCFGLNSAAENTYRLIFFNPVLRQAWTLIVIDEGDSFNLE